jgi:hypothetical protein
MPPKTDKKKRKTGKRGWEGDLIIPGDHTKGKQGMVKKLCDKEEVDMDHRARRFVTTASFKVAEEVARIAALLVQQNGQCTISGPSINYAAFMLFSDDKKKVFGGKGGTFETSAPTAKRAIRRSVPATIGGSPVRVGVGAILAVRDLIDYVATSLIVGGKKAKNERKGGQKVNRVDIAAALRSANMEAQKELLDNVGVHLLLGGVAKDIKRAAKGSGKAKKKKTTMPPKQEEEEN